MEILKSEHIEHKIYTVRGVQIMLDADLAELYETETKFINRAVKRNPGRFPESFVFQTTEEEWLDLRFQIGTSSPEEVLRFHFGTLKTGRGHHKKYLPYAFTEQGVAMLSAVLRSEVAVKVSIEIMQAFVNMRKFLLQNASVFHRLNHLEWKQLQTDEKIEKVFKALEAGQIQPDKGIFFDGQVFDAYTFTADLVKKAKTDIILIDNYVDETVLTLLSKRKPNVSATIFTKAISKALQLDVEKHNAQYPHIKIKALSQSHDRFLLLDKKELYHFGASLKDLGKRWFAFSRMDSLAEQMLDQLTIQVP